MPARFLIDRADTICEPLTNLSIQSEEFPCDMKSANINPIYKKKAKTITIDMYICISLQYYL